MRRVTTGVIEAPPDRLRSCACTQAQLQSEVFQGWVTRIGERPLRMHRKIWEYCFIAQALHERGMLEPGRRGLGFAVGHEPMPSLFASFGCEIVATDVATEQARKAGWVETDQHADSLEALNRRGLCDPERFRRNVSFRFADMRAIPADLGSYDFVWSSCSLEHLGTMALGKRFVEQSMKHLKPGGVGVHTTEYNLGSNLFTLTRGSTVLFRKRDLREIAARVERLGGHVDLDFTEGDLPFDRVVDKPPYQHEVHLRLRVKAFVATSFGLIVEKASEPASP
ncbi:MAG: class I SAM-dependent methyltransferase [Candidatus Eisenbacteria bacterium]|uniref:Class I SAM-dependent methyltransferase n=1 Tax=Eiseniibacteriota bacterium TaxID=2212470 RepID=A0A849SRU3_UNCEI|nr:class I SAM-dependent methyltransferase [Candidatus Eisenbacteria bacterium]